MLEVKMKPISLVLSFILCISCYARTVCIDSSRDYAILDQFFKMAFILEEYGYVLEGSKPISLRNFLSPEDFPITKDFKQDEIELKNSLLVREAITVWNKLYGDQNNFALKAKPLDNRATFPNLELSFINIPKLRQVIEKNIDLFHYVLGPTLTTESLIDRIISSDESLAKILNYDLPLIGIVLGFGSHNSIVGGRQESICALSISKDHPPFAPQSYLMQDKGEHSLDFLTPERYGTYYLEFAGGDDNYFRVKFPPLRPLSNFSNLEEELKAIDALEESLPSSLLERPKYVFGAYRGGPANQPFFKQLLEAQKKIRILVERPDFLECILMRVSSEKPLIRFDKKALSLQKPMGRFVAKWNDILKQAASRFESKEKRTAFIQALSHSTKNNCNPPVMIGASVAALEGLKKARRNLAKANKCFERLSKDLSLTPVASKLLYFKTTNTGRDREIKGGNHVRIGYIIEDQEGNILSANHDIWLHLSQTIPGFAHGVQGMHVQEKRTLFIHPSLGYGALTTLPPCSALVVKVHLIDVDQQSTGLLPPLTQVDLSWIEKDSFYKDLEDSLKQQPYFAGAFFREMTMLALSEAANNPIQKDLGNVDRLNQIAAELEASLEEKAR